jgi:hypothetical protein
MTRRATAFVSRPRAALVLAIVASLAADAAAQDASKPRAIAYKVKRAVTVSGAAIDDAVLLVEGGKIVKIGKASEVEIPDAADVTDLPELTASPGFIHVASLAFLPQPDFDGQGRREGGDRRIADEINPTWEQVGKLARAGFTRLNIVPPDGGIAGYGCLVRPIPRTERPLRAEQLVSSRESCLMTGFAPRTTNKAFWKELFQKTDPKKDEAKGDESPRSGSRPSGESRPTSASRPTDSKAADARDAKTAPFLDVLDRKLPCFLFLGNSAAFAHFEVYFKDHPKFRPVLILRPDAWVILDQVKKLGVPVVLSTSASQRPDTNILRQAALEAMDRGIATAVIPETNFASGYADFAFHLAELIRRGADPAQALRAATLTPAEMLGVADETGSLDAGKTADVLFWTGEPLAPTSRLVRALAAGAVVYDETKEP